MDIEVECLACLNCTNCVESEFECLACLNRTNCVESDIVCDRFPEGIVLYVWGIMYHPSI
jgi:hypothetical protein